MFRKLQQFVPEFNDFIASNPIKDGGLSPQQGSDLLGPFARSCFISIKLRIIHRRSARWEVEERLVSGDDWHYAFADVNWISGAPVVNNPIHDNPDEGSDDSKVNNFSYREDPDEVKCPFAAHLRKLNLIFCSFRT